MMVELQLMEVLYDFVKTLPPDRPSPFAQEIFMESDEFTPRPMVLKSIRSKKQRDDGRWQETSMILEKGMVLGKHKKNYLPYSVVSGTHKLEVAQGEVLEGFCTILTRKFPEGWTGRQDKGESEVSVPKKRPKKRGPKGAANQIEHPDDQFEREESDVYNAQEQEPAPVTWDFAAIATIQSFEREFKFQCHVPKQTMEVGGIYVDVEPSWNNVVDTLKREVRIRELHAQQQDKPVKAPVASQNPQCYWQHAPAPQGL
jgi:hypothetical protein